MKCMQRRLAGIKAALPLALWLGFALLLNFGTQILTFRASRQKNAGAAIVSGNRNIALFLIALPEAVIDPLLIFIGCYQIPMYLTPILLRRLHERV